MGGTRLEGPGVSIRYYEAGLGGQRGAAAGARLVKAPFLSGGAEGPAWAQRDGRGADKSVRVLMMLRAYKKYLFKSKQALFRSVETFS